MEWEWKKERFPFISSYRFLIVLIIMIVNNNFPRVVSLPRSQKDQARLLSKWQIKS